MLLQVVTACTILHNICLSAGDVLAPEDEPEDDVEEDEGRLTWRPSAVLSGGTNSVLRCLPWRLYHQVMTTFNKQVNNNFNILFKKYFVMKGLDSISPVYIFINACYRCDSR